MHLSIGPLRITLAKTYRHGNALYYQRHVPKDLRSRYPSRVLKHNLQTLDPVKAARQVEGLERRYDAEFAALRADPASSPQALQVHADSFLVGFGLVPQGAPNDPAAMDRLHEYIDDKRGRFAGGDERVYASADESEYLTPVELEAGARLHRVARVTLDEALEVYLRAHENRDNLKFVTYQRRAFATLTATA
ncbi:MAG: recombinase, partial [Ramlibacter sp.]|nr:recombinase [Ramlibacter sp.]